MSTPDRDKLMRVYADTSVFGGPFDPQFANVSKKFFDELAGWAFHLVLSALTVQELLGAPERVRAVLDGVARDHVEIHDIIEEMDQLKSAYLASGILGASSDADALQVAAATVLNADMIVSWNFKHIVHFEKIRACNAIDRLRGYKEIEVYSPLEIAP